MTQQEITQLLADHTYIHMCTSRRRPGTYFSSLVQCDAYAALKQLAMTLDVLEGYGECAIDGDTDEMLACYPHSLIQSMTL